MTDPLKQFIERLTEIGETIRPFLRAIKKLPDIVRHIDLALAENPTLIQYIQAAIDNKIPKTAAYHLHRNMPKLAGKKYRGMLPPLPKKYRMRKDRFLALYEYLKAQKEKEEKYYRTSRVMGYDSSESGHIELRLWVYTKSPIEDPEKDLDEEWSTAITYAILATNSALISRLEEIESDELNEEVDEDEGSDWDEWQGVLDFDGIEYSYASEFQERV